MFSRNRGGFARFIRIVIDVLNILLAVAVVLATIWTFLSVSHRLWVFPWIFAMGAGINILTGIKYLMTERLGGGIAMMIIGVLLGLIALTTYYSVGGLM